MSDYKTCANGHAYQQSEPECPYCPKPRTLQTTDRTEGFPQGRHNGGTEIFRPATGSTMPFNGGGMQGGHAGGHTIIMAPPGAAAGSMAPSTRKLVGWLVTFDNQPLGRDYRLYEGKNVVGGAPGSEVHADFDSSVSGKHATILYRAGGFMFRDELSTNGTFLNGVMSNEGPLQDGDELRVGNTTFLLRTAAKK